tara:strand:- start:2159 stop:3331 length:1173 start_codon:yes stop_codon:yes gene_type:complete
MIGKIILLYPFFLLLLSVSIGKFRVSRVFTICISIAIIFLTNTISQQAVQYVIPGDFMVYKKVFESCTSIKNCYDYSSFESGFTFIVGFLRQYLNLSGLQIWSLINFINLALITLISKTLSNYFRKEEKFISIQTLIIAFTFPSFLLISIRAGLAFLIISFLLIEVIKNSEKGLKFLFNFKNFFIAFLAITIHLQALPLLLLIIIFLKLKENYIINSDLNFIEKLFKGLISKKLILIFVAIVSLIFILYFNYYEIMRFIGKSYYHFRIQSERTLGIRTLVDQIIILTIIKPTILDSNFYKKNIDFQKFFKTFVFFQTGTITLYYLILFVIGIDGFARQCQYNFLTFLLIHTLLNKKFTILGVLPLLYSIFTVYYTFSSDTNFKILEFNLL